MRFLTGFFVTVPAIATAWLLYVFWDAIDEFFSPGYQHLFGRQLKGEEIVVIGDTPLDVKCGRAIGANVLAVATGGASLDELVRCKPDWAVPDLTHLSVREICRR